MKLPSSFVELLGEGAVAFAGSAEAAPHGTTIVAVTYDGGVAMAGDRRATWGNMIAQHTMQKVFAADESSLIGVAGTAGVAVEVVRLFAVELEHYEKIEGTPLSFDGKASRLAGMLRGNLARALEGFGVLPLFAGWDAGRGRIVSFDVVGGRYEEGPYYAIGSGAGPARGSLKKLFRADLDERGAVIALLQALVDAADEDSATAGPDVLRQVYPVVWVADAGGVRQWEDGALASVVDEVLTARRGRPDGPGAPLL